MGYITSAFDRQPKGDHNRRVALGIDADEFARRAGITAEELHDYEFTSPDHHFDPEVAARVGETLAVLEARDKNAATSESSISTPLKDNIMDHSRHTPLAATELNAAILEGATIYGPGDEHVGKVAHVHGLGAISQVVVDVGGFLGLGAKPVALNVSDLSFMRDENGDVHGVTRFSKDELKALPEHKDH